MKIEIKTYDLTVTVEHKNDDLTVEDYFEIFNGLLSQIGFQKMTIDQHIIELASELKEDYNKN
jgi:hypothetical protein